jgi:LmbE family N-acetylglucosaminyl deacetylase
MLVPVITLVTMLLIRPSTAAAKVQQYPRLHVAGRHDRVLIVAPHIDDESISAGGYALDALANGAEVFVVFITAGDCNRFTARLMHKTFEPTTSNYLAVGRRRIDEAHDAMQLLGIPRDHYFVLGYPDRGLRSMLDHRTALIRSTATGEQSVPYSEALTPGAPYSFKSLMSDMERVIDITQPTTVIAPVAFDRHPDHAAAAEITDDILEHLDVRPTRLGYLVHTGVPKSFVNTPERALLPPNRMKAFSWVTYALAPDVQAEKTKILMTYKSQRPYVFLLRNAFVRANELFFLYPHAVEAAAVAPAAAPARLLIAR